MNKNNKRHDLPHEDMWMSQQVARQIILEKQIAHAEKTGNTNRLAHLKAAAI